MVGRGPQAEGWDVWNPAGGAGIVPAVVGRHAQPGTQVATMPEHSRKTSPATAPAANTMNIFHDSQ